MELSENGKILLGILQDARTQNILLNMALIEIIRKRLGISGEEMGVIVVTYKEV